MIQRIAAMERPQRILIYILMVTGVVALCAALTLFLSLQAINSAPRTLAARLSPDVTVSEFAVLPDDDSYPASVAVGSDGTVYTGSYTSGAIWKIDSAGQVTEIPNTRNTLFAVSGITAAPDGTLFVVDRLNSQLGSRGGTIMRVTPDNVVSAFGSIEGEEGFVTPDDIALDGRGYVFVTDWGRDVVWRFNPEGGSGVVWWRSPIIEGVEAAPTGIAYDALNTALIITDPERDTIYRVSAFGDTPEETAAQTEILYQHGDQPDTPGFDGVTVSAEGGIYVTALALNRVARLQDGALTYLAAGFRGGSDVEYTTQPDGQAKLYVSNWDQFSLLNDVFDPRLPFAIDVIRFTPG